MKKTVLILGCLLTIGVSSISCNRDTVDNSKPIVDETKPIVEEVKPTSFFTSSGTEFKVILTKDGSTVDLEATKKLNKGTFPSTGNAALDGKISNATQDDVKKLVEAKDIMGGKLLFVKNDKATLVFRSSVSLLKADAFKGSTAKKVGEAPLDENKYDITKVVAPSWVDTKIKPTKYHEVTNPEGYTLYNNTGWFFAPKK